jgi:hypothetical protein
MTYELLPLYSNFLQPNPSLWQRDLKELHKYEITNDRCNKG